MEKENIKNILRESVDLSEAEGEEKATPSEYERIRSLLDNDKVNHAGVIKQLWGSKDATKRSLFRKKLNKMENDSGGTYEFSKEEVSKIMSIMMNFANEISSTVKPSKQTYKGE
jgi:predicted AAA+ superfamily ATPase